MNNNDLSFIVHSENDAFKVIDSLRDLQLFKLCLTCFVEKKSCDVFYYDDYIHLDSYIHLYPYKIRVEKIRQAFRDAVFTIYHTNFL